MRTFVAIILSAALCSIFFWLGGIAYGNGIGAIVANAALFLMLFAYAASRARPLPPPVILSASLAATALLAICAGIGGIVYERSHSLGLLMMSAVSIGDYPAGADVPLIPGMITWGASAIAVMLAGLGIGTLIALVRNRRNDPGLEEGTAERSNS